MKMAGQKLKWPLVGNQHITEYLEQCIARGNVGGTYIFNGPSDLGKSTAAICFAQTLLCQNYDQAGIELPCETCPSCRYFHRDESGEGEKQAGDGVHGDCHIIRRESDKKNIPVELVRDFIRILSLSSFLGSYKVGIIRDAEYLSPEAANALLKTLEEPKQRVVIILVCSDLEALPKTIVSRSQVLWFRPVKTDIIHDYLLKEYKASRSEAKKYSRLSLGRPALAVKFFENKEASENYRKQVDIFLKFFRQNINERFAAIDSLVGKKISGPETAGIVRGALLAWQGLVRDLMLTHLGFGHLIQHQICEAEINALRS